MTLKNTRMIGIGVTVMVLLLIPFIAMQFTNEVNWTIFDFIVMGVLLTGTGITFEFAMRKVAKKEHRIIIGVAILMAFLLIWAELAVGIFGTPFAGS